MKEENHVAVVASGSMSGLPFSPAQPPLPTPSPFSFSVASSRWSSRPPLQTANLFLRFLSLVLSFGAALSLVALPSTNTKLKNHPELMYLFIANILVVLYAACQLFKSICDIAHRGIFISDMVSDYVSFIFDQFSGYLLASASSVAARLVQQMNSGDTIWKATMVSVCISFASFLVIAAAALLSGYKLCKRIIW